MRGHATWRLSVGQDVDAHGFPVKDSFYITMASLPAKVKNILVHVNNFGGSGMRDVKSLCTRVVDASEHDPNAHRDLFVVTVPSAKAEHGNRTVAVLAKIYKEYVGMSVCPSLSEPAETWFDLCVTCKNQSSGVMSFLCGYHSRTFRMQTPPLRCSDKARQSP